MKKESNEKSWLIILSLLLAISTTSSAIYPNLVGWCEFEEGTGIIVYDSSGNGNDGLLAGPPEWVGGRIGNYALDFDGAGDYVDMGDTVKNYLGTSYTVSAWIKADAIAPSKVIAAYRHSSIGNPVLFQLDHYNADARWTVRDDSGNSAQAIYSNAITAGIWYHVAGVREGDTLNVYVNGVSGTWDSQAFGTISPDNLKVGALQFGGNPPGAFFGGIIDDVRIYDRALSAEEILGLYLGDKAFIPAPADGAEGVELNTVLSWTSGYQAFSHDVYLGTDYNDVNDANTLSDQYKGTYGINNYDPCGLEPETTYYWRVDENSASGTVKGDVWDFSTLILSKNAIDFPDDCLRNEGIFENDPAWVKFTIKLDSPSTVYFQNSTYYVFHYDFATAELSPFIGMGPAEYYQITLYESGQQAALGAVILPCMVGEPPAAAFNEYGIQFIRYDPYTKEEIRDMFNVVKANVLAEPGVEAFYFPSYEQLAIAEANRDWFESEGITVSSTARWAEGNACYAEGWALGKLKYFAGDQIEAAYLAGNLLAEDILLTDGVPAEIPFVAGILSLLPSTPNSHVAILARTFGVPFAHLAVAEDATEAQQLVGHTILLSVSEDGGVCEVGLKDLEGILTPGEIAEILALKEPPELNIQPMASFGDYSADTNDLVPADIQYFGGKAANYRILRDAIPDNCPVAVAFSFDLWNEFLDQTLTPHEGVVIEAGGYLLFWADNDEEQGALHTNFKLSADGEYIGLYDTDGTTLIDGLSFGPQSGDVSYGRSPDGNDNWVFFSGGTATPNSTNTGSGGPTEGLFINEFMAENDSTIQDPEGSGYPDWIELYNAGPSAIELGDMYLTDDESDPTKWMIPAGISGNTLRQEIANRLGGYSYPPADIAALSADLAVIRNMITNASVTSFSQQLQDAVIAVLQETNYGFDANREIRFRSSTNVEDSNQFTSAGLYDSYSGCLADDLDGDDVGPCICDAEENNERGVFRAIRKVFASFYNDNAFLERLRHNVNEADVGMALLVHHSFPDEFELANGVATLEKEESGPNIYIKLVTQDGAVSVANPEDGSIPEEVSVVYVSSSEIDLTLVRASNLVILGDTVMEWEDDYNDLSQLLVASAEEFELVTGKTEYILDFEYKKVAPGGAAIPGGGLVVKQIREIPQSGDAPGVTTPFLIGGSMECCLVQGEYMLWACFDGSCPKSDVFAYHRLKSRWTLDTRNLWLTTENLNNQSFYSDVTVEYAADGRIRTLTGQLPLLPEAFHGFSTAWYSDYTTDGWVWHHLANPRTYKLFTEDVPTEVSPDESPIVSLGSSVVARAEYARPVPSYATGSLSNRTMDTIKLEPCPGPGQNNYLQERTFYDEVDDVNITTSYYWDREPMMGGITGALMSWVETVIEGYTTEPIVLHGWYSQTYLPDHHNAPFEYFVFEPQLEPGISQDILEELRAQDIRLIFFRNSNWPSLYDSFVTTLGFEDETFILGDIEPDGDVDFVDFANFAESWLESVCDACNGADLTGDGRVNWNDMLELADNWLEGL